MLKTDSVIRENAKSTLKTEDAINKRMEKLYFTYKT